MKQKTRRKALWAWMLILTLALSLPPVSIQAANEGNTMLFTEMESEVVDTGNAAEEEAKLRQELANSYSKLEEKYQKEKTFSRTVIYALIFVIAILVVGLINIIIYYRAKLYGVSKKVFEDDFLKKEELINEEKSQEEIIPQESVQKEMIQKEPVILEDDFAKKIAAEVILKEEDELKTIQIEEEIPLEEVHIEEDWIKEVSIEENSVEEILLEKKRFKAPAHKPKRKKAGEVTEKSVIRINDLEVLDFNDED